MSIRFKAMSAALAAVIATTGLLAADVAEARRDPYKRGHYAERQALKRAYVAGAVREHRREEWRREVDDYRDRERRRDRRNLVGAVVGAAVVGAVIKSAID